VIEEEIIRIHQAKYLLKWIDINTSKDSFTLILGDFNFLPSSDSYNFMLNEGYISAHSNIYGKEPEKTFHNKIDAPFKDNDPEGTFDYFL
jgi:endonuclease/exonuclease/phosphatase family metal-dependent hydrolase